MAWVVLNGSTTTSKLLVPSLRPHPRDTSPFTLEASTSSVTLAKQVCGRRGYRQCRAQLCRTLSSKPELGSSARPFGDRSVRRIGAVSGEAPQDTVLPARGGDGELPWVSEPQLLQGCEPGAAPLRVAMLLSGGVDSSVALRLVQAAGHEVTAFYLKIWVQEDFRNFWGECPWEQDLHYAQAVCEEAGVELRTVALTEEYWDRVVAHTIAEVAAGRTPNPDMLCNSRIKFGAFLDHLHEDQPARFDRVASGHYAALRRRPGAGQQEQVELVLSADARKDQTYFLANISRDQLGAAMFPLGGLPKPRVRQLAEQLALATAARKDSQGICFLGKVKFSEFVAAHLGQREGELQEFETGQRVGVHAGFWYYTVGQRQGLGLAGGPWYVVSKDTDANIVYVSKHYHEMDLRRDRFQVADFNWFAGGAPAGDGPARVKLRHGAHSYACRLTFHDSTRAAATVTLDGDDQGIAAGQYAVFYGSNGVCLGCGVIQRSLEGTRQPHPTARGSADAPPADYSRLQSHVPSPMRAGSDTNASNGLSPDTLQGLAEGMQQI